MDKKKNPYQDDNLKLVSTQLTKQSKSSVQLLRKRTDKCNIMKERNPALLTKTQNR